MTNRILILAAHPDDEVLGCGGTIARHADAGDDVHVLIAAEGATSRDVSRRPKLRRPELTALADVARRTGEILGACSVELLGLPDNRLDSLDRLDLVKSIEAVVSRLQPAIVYTHHAGDVNIDHRRLHEAAVTACRPQPRHPVQQLLAFEVPSSTEWMPPDSAQVFAPTRFIDISTTWPRKRAALEAYATEMRPWPHARSLKAIEHLARWRGASVGVDAAEAFVVLREVWRE